MKLKQLHLYNFRCFSSLSIMFDDKLTVIAAENGAGKTAILDAIAIGFGRYLTKLPGVTGRTTKATDIRVNDLEKQAPFLLLAWQVEVEKAMLSWSSGRKRDASISTSQIEDLLSKENLTLFKQGSRGLDAFTLDLIQREAEDKPVFLPVVAYYGTNRAIRDEVQRRRGFKHKFSRFDALSGSLEPNSSFRAAFEWFNAMEDLERREQQAKRDFDYRLPELQWVRQAIKQTLNGNLADPRTLIRPLRFVIDKVNSDGSRQTLRISQLSDGYKIVLGLVMDLARRMVEANPNAQQLKVASPLELPAIVLIDEVELHLHPSWQQHVLGDLMRVFTNTQFIVTTHSPQVLTCVDASCIRIFKEEAEPGTNVIKRRVEPVDLQTKGVASSDLLAQVMNVNPIPPIEEAQWFSDYTAKIENGTYKDKDGLALRKKLVLHFGSRHPQMLDADRLIRFQTFKLHKKRTPQD